MEYSSLIPVVGAILGMLNTQRIRNEMRKELQYVNVLAEHNQLADTYIKAVKEANKELNENDIFDVKKFSKIKDAKQMFISTITERDSKFRNLKKYSDLIKAYDVILASPASSESVGEKINLENALIRTFAKHLLSVKNYIHNLNKKDKKQLETYLRNLKHQTNRIDKLLKNQIKKNNK